MLIGKGNCCLPKGLLLWQFQLQQNVIFYDLRILCRSQKLGSLYYSTCTPVLYCTRILCAFSELWTLWEQKVAASLGRHAKGICHCRLLIEANLTKGVEVKRKTSRCADGTLYMVYWKLNMTEVTQIIRRAISALCFQCRQSSQQSFGPLPLWAVIGAKMMKRDVSN